MYQNNPNIHIPDKKPRKTKDNPKPKLTKEQKEQNTKISKQRIDVENVIGDVKVFRLISDKYRCERKRFGLRFNLIAGFYNWELKKSV